MADKFKSFETLSKAHKKGVDFNIHAKQRHTGFCIVAPHAGKIETMTGELTQEIAGSEHSYYVFEGKMQSLNSDLHITSTNFNEPTALSLIGKTCVALGIHGRKDSADINGTVIDDTESIFLGGLDESFKVKLEKRFKDAGFKTITAGHAFPATDKANICNRGSSGKGAQIELPKSLRDRFRDNKGLRGEFVDAVRAAITDYEVELRAATEQSSEKRA